jgi:hypothetical protein
MVRSVHEVARRTEISIKYNILHPENCDIQQTFGPGGARYCRFYGTRLCESQVSVPLL